MTRLLDLTGQRFDRLVVLRREPHPKRVHWLTQCDCGKVATVAAVELRAGKTRSCGCRRAEICGITGARTARANSRIGAAKAGLARTKHGHARRGDEHPLYKIWEAIVARCENPKGKRWHRYGGRGIAVCKGWRGSAAKFISDMGPRPRGTSIDRKNNDGGYWCGACDECLSLGRPPNCRWATAIEQANNKSRSVRDVRSGARAFA